MNDTKRKPEGASYNSAGVNIDAGQKAVDLMKSAVRSTWNDGVLAKYGSFAGLFKLGAADRGGDVLAVTIDGVGTKLKIAVMCERYASVGMDLVNHCTNDLLVQRAAPLLFADYFASCALGPEIVAEAVSGMAEACRAVDCVLIAGETAEMPGVYCEGEIDLVGCMIGLAQGSDVMNAPPVAPGDVLIGLPSTGLHTNGYSLARHILFQEAGMYVETRVPELQGTLGEELLNVHREYLSVLKPHLGSRRIHGLVHITGGGFYDNIARILPEGCEAMVQRSSWDPLPIFKLLVSLGELPDEEAYRVFNMGIGMVVIVDHDGADDLIDEFSTSSAPAVVIGEVRAGETGVVLV